MGLQACISDVSIICLTGIEDSEPDINGPVAVIELYIVIPTLSMFLPAWFSTGKRTVSTQNVDMLLLKIEWETTQVTGGFQLLAN